MLSHQLLLASAAFAIPMLAARQAGLVSTIMVTVYDLPVGVQPSTEWGTPATPVASAVAAGATPSMVAGVQLANVAAAAPAVAPTALVSAVNSAEFGDAHSNAAANTANGAPSLTNIVYTTITLDAAQLQALQTGTPLKSIVEGLKNAAPSPVAGSTPSASPNLAAGAAAQTPAAQVAASIFNTAAAAPVPASTTQEAAPAAATTPASGSGTFTGQGTYFEIGLGACGNTNTDQELVCAVSASRYDSALTGSNPNTDPLCGKQITVSANGKSVTLTVVDRCQACAEDDLDLSPTAFQQLSPLSAGRMPITWSYS